MTRITTLAAAAALALSSLGAGAQTGADDPQHADGRSARESGNFPASRSMRAADRAADQESHSKGYPAASDPLPGTYNRGHDARGDYNRGHDGRSTYNRGDEGHNGYAQRDWQTYGYEHRWQRGDRLPPEYRSNSYVVDDWRGHHLYAPPRGYHWVQQGNDYLLVAIATGIIASVLLNQ